MTEERKRPAPMALALDDDDDVEMEILSGKLAASSVLSSKDTKTGYSEERRLAAIRAHRKRRQPPEEDKGDILRGVKGDERPAEPKSKKGRPTPELVLQQLKTTASWNTLKHMPKHLLAGAILPFLTTGDQQSQERGNVMVASKQLYEGVRAMDRARSIVTLGYRWNRLFANSTSARKAVMALDRAHPVRESVHTLQFIRCESFFGTTQRSDNAWTVGAIRELFPRVSTLVIDNQQRSLPDLRDVLRLVASLPLQTLEIGHLPMDFFPGAVGGQCPTLRHLSLGSTAAHLDGFHQWRQGLASLLTLNMASMRPRKTAHEITDVLQACKSLVNLDVGVHLDVGIHADNDLLVQNMLRSLPRGMTSIRIHVDNPSSYAPITAATVHIAARGEDKASVRFPGLQTLVLDVITSNDEGSDDEEDVVMSAGESEAERQLEKDKRRIQYEMKRREHRHKKHEDLRGAVIGLLEACRVLRELEIEAPYLLTDDFMLRTRDLAYGLEVLTFIPEATRHLYNPLTLDLTTYCNWRGSHAILNRLSLPHGKARFVMGKATADLSGLVQRAKGNNMLALRMHFVSEAPLGSFAAVIRAGKAIRHIELTGSGCVVDQDFLRAFQGGSQVAHLGFVETPFSVRTLKLEGDMDFADSKSWITMVQACPQLQSVSLTPANTTHSSVVLLLRALVENKTAEVALSGRYAKAVGEAPTFTDLVLLAQLMDSSPSRRAWNYTIQVGKAVRNEAWQRQAPEGAVIGDHGSFETLVRSRRLDSTDAFLIRWVYTSSRGYQATMTRALPK